MAFASRSALLAALEIYKRVSTVVSPAMNRSERTVVRPINWPG
jgi:hypothetical protein